MPETPGITFAVPSGWDMSNNTGLMPPGEGVSDSLCG